MPDIPIIIPAYVQYIHNRFVTSDSIAFMRQAAKDMERFGANSDPDALDAEAAAAAAVAVAAPAPKTKVKTKHSLRGAIARFGLKVRTKAQSIKAQTKTKTKDIKGKTKPANDRHVAHEIKIINQHFVCLEHEVARLERKLEEEHERIKRLMRRVQTLETILHKEGRYVSEDA